MDKKLRRINRLQNIAIAALSCSALLLVIQTPLFHTFRESAMLQTMEHILHRQESTVQTEENFIYAANPVRLLLRGGVSGYGSDTLTTTDPTFSAAAIFLADGFATAQQPIAVGENTLVQAMRYRSLYVDFRAALPLPVIVDMLQTESNLSAPLTVRRVLLSAEEERSIVYLYLVDAAGEVFMCTTAIDMAVFTEYLASVSGNDTMLAADIPEYDRFSPYTFLPDTIEPRMAVNAGIVQPDVDKLMEQTGFNEHVSGLYTEASGTVVVLDSPCMLRIEPDGNISYVGEAAETSHFYLDMQNGGITEAVFAAYRTAISITQELRGAASLYLSSAAETAEGYHITFDYMLNGTPLYFSDGTHAAEFTIEQSCITEFHIRLRRYTLLEQAASLLPLQQAIAAARGLPYGAELSVAYVDNGGEMLSVRWIADETA